MSEPTAEETRTQAQFELVPQDDPTALAVYSNFAQATAGPHDLTLHFGWYAIPALNEPPNETVKVDVRPMVKVTIPIALVGGTIKILQSQLDAWKDAFRGQTERVEEQESREERPT